MSVELNDLFHAAARDETAEAAREYPLGPDTVRRFVGAARRRRAARVVILAAAGTVVVGALALGVDYYRQGEPLAASPTPAITSSAVATPSETPSPSLTPSPTAAESPTPSAPSPVETTPPAAEGTTPPAPRETPVGSVPGQVTTVSAGPGGGSGEILVDWNTVADATGYRVYRSSSAGGPFVSSASVIVATGVTTVEFGGSYELIQMWPPSSDSYEYVEVAGGARTYFRVVAFNTAGSGAKSAVVCGAPVGAEPAC